ncbi:MAG TPA: cytochrome c biogenesis protein CcdA [Candidatus Limnocylindria bacterium]|nr:cytochrome c biogenesis protein CcdA [Candidatus Limnocylindria bacterium]
MEVTFVLAFVAGLLSFVSPCVLALVPVYLAFLGEAVAIPTPAAAGGREPGQAASLASPALVPALLFVSGFSLLFITLGTSLGLVGEALFRSPAARIVAGVAVIAIGVLTTGILGPVLDRWRVALPTDMLPASRNARALALGALVAIGWSPCIGPVLGAILTMGASTQQAGLAALLLAAYSAGLAVPFLAAAVALPQVRPLFDWLRRHHGAVQVASGLFIVLIGVLILTNAFSVLANLFTFFI